MNHMSEVAKILGVELGEKFHVKFNSGFNSVHDESNEYYLCDAGVKLDKTGHACISSDMLFGLLTGEISIKQKPWKPELDDIYYFVDEDGHVCTMKWTRSYVDLMLQKLGNCYQTKEDAKENREKWFAFYSNEDVLEV